MAFVAASSPKIPANRQYPVASRASGDGPDTAQYGLVWPNEWPNGEIHARDDERARGARDGRDRSYRHGVGGSSKQHERTGVTAGALPGQLAASSPAGLAAANDLTIPIPPTCARATSASPRSVGAGGKPVAHAFLHSHGEWDVERRAGDCCRRRGSGLDRAHTCAQRTADRPRSPGDRGRAQRPADSRKR
jgi:hypothetical protein